MTRFLIAPSILAADFGRMAEQAQEAEAAGADALHVDIMDGHFVPEISFGKRMTEALASATALPLDVHLMVANPARHIAPFALAGAHTITIHYEAAPPAEIPGLLGEIKRRGTRVGLALKPDTHASVLQDLYPFLDQILVMTVEPGYSGQPFQHAQLPKLSQIAAAAPPTTTLAVDGGIDEQTLPQCASHGATFFVAGSSVFSARRSVAAGIAALRGAVFGERP